MPTNDIDPYTPSEGVFECLGCGTRTRSNSHPGTCPECDGAVRNIAVSRE
ncbi:rubrerythrin-like domain-containing protein [Halobaculum magnesiiphilum]|uniref:Rubrerythrin-like domain-containing protein n=1 Tax=Halobaculum magnesiiphilum TaxID=1017351 RepID=A0A8T8WE41_9EURY|nr:rubrerythrin-like domain-containing protein [Halobaculum magnesiiphilum]QZP38101.1 rubrerythrin-like domain-containing protein [Halobaculum magnesiiphilum]